MDTIYSIGMSTGLGMIASATFYMVYTGIKQRLYYFKKNIALDSINRILTSTDIKPYEMLKENKKALIAGAVGSILLAILGIGTKYLWWLAAIGLLMGIGAHKGYYVFKHAAIIHAKKRQVAVLFEAVEMYLRANMSLVQALYAAKSLTPLLNDAVRSCIVRWPAGPEKALENLRKDIGVPEADVLVSLLHWVNVAGLKNMEGVVQREAQSIDKMRNVAVKMKIKNRPLYYLLHRGLLVITIMGMFLGSMFYHLSKTMQAAGLKF